jgi:hypothetical protein
VYLLKALESAQKDAADLQNYIRYNLTPLVFEQVGNIFFPSFYITVCAAQISGIETALGSIEMAIGRLSSKRMTRLKLRAGLVTSDNALGATYPGGMFRQGSSVPEASSRGPKNTSIVQGAVLQAEQLKGELERVKSGILLLNQTSERLGEIVRKDSQWCGGICEGLWNIFSRRSGTTIIRKRDGGSSGGYSFVEMTESDHQGNGTMIDASPLRDNSMGRSSSL